MSLPFFHLTGKHAKKERHQRKTQLHMQNMSRHAEFNKHRSKKNVGEKCNKKQFVRPWSDALNYVFMNPKLTLLRWHWSIQAYVRRIIRSSNASL